MRVELNTERVETEEEEQAKIEWLRAAVKVAEEQIERGDCIEFESMDDLADFIDTLDEQVAAELAAERKSG